MFNSPTSLVNDQFRPKTGISEYIDAENLGRSLRSKNVPVGADPETKTYTEAEYRTGDRPDWRVKLSLPKGGAYKIPESDAASSTDPHILSELTKTDGFVFPYTPQIFITHSASYDKLAPTHSNYPFPIYENSQVDQFTITGDFTAENAAEGRYWIAANHYLRSITKMNYGTGSGRGNPPPVVKLNGYGDFIFKDVPVVIEQYQLTLPQEVDYIKVPLASGTGSWVPTQSNIAISVHVAYSRDKVNRFSLAKFVKGDYVASANSPGFI
jgi:hypothetical protein